MGPALHGDLHEDNASGSLVDDSFDSTDSIDNVVKDFCGDSTAVDPKVRPGTFEIVGIAMQI